jgi:hypothetical protein
MSFQNCMKEALDVGAITKQEHDDLIAKFERHSREQGGDGVRAKSALEEELRAEGMEKKRQALLSRAKAAEIGDDLKAYRNAGGNADIVGGIVNLFEHWGHAGYSSVVGRFNALMGDSVATMERMLYETRRTFGTGQYRAKEAIEGVVDAAFGKPTGDAARAFYDAFQQQAEKLRQLFNEAGGNIAKLESWGLPQSHNASALVRAGKERWKQAISPLLDLDKMRDPLTQGLLSRERLDGILGHVWESIVTDGWNAREPTMQATGKGSLANRRQDHRFLAFKGPDEWRIYQRDFGEGDVFGAMTSHLRSMSRDVAAMQILGPNPDATVTWLKQIVDQERAKAITGKPSLWYSGTDGVAAGLDAFARENVASYVIDNTWREVRGSGGPVNAGLANGLAGLRNVMVASRLEKAVITAVIDDPRLQAQARMLVGMPVAKMAGSILNQFSQGGRQQALRAGLNIEAAMHVLHKEARFAGSVGGPEWTRWLPDRVLTWTGLEPWTRAGKSAFGLDFMGFVGDHQGKAFEALPDRLRNTMEGYGIDADHWAAMQAAKLDEPEKGATYLLPRDIQATDHPLAQAAAMKYLEMIHQETERAVPTSTARGKAIMSAGTREGTVAGEFVRSAMMFKSFTASYMLTWGSALANEVGPATGVAKVARGAAYVGPVLIAGAVTGGIAYQLKQIASGKDVMDPKDPKFWMAGLATGGGLGIYSDFLFADQTRFGHSLGETLAGPMVQTLGDVGRTGQSAIKSYWTGKNSVGAPAIKLAKDNFPGADMWFLGPAFDRVITDQLQYLATPDAHKTMRGSEQTLRRQTGQGYFWKPGALTPDRMPTIADKP